jgi:hypothetical protein
MLILQFFRPVLLFRRAAAYKSPQLRAADFWVLLIIDAAYVSLMALSLGLPFPSAEIPLHNAFIFVYDSFKLHCSFSKLKCIKNEGETE